MVKNKLIELYKDILKAASMDYDDEGFIFVKVGDDRRPAKISDGRQMVLPTQEQLMYGDHKSVVVFHPLRENIMRPGESEVLSKLRSVFNIKLNSAFGVIGTSLLTLCASTEDHKKLSPDQSEMLSVIKGVDEDTIKRFQKIMIKGLTDSVEKTFVNIYLKRKAVFDDKTYSRGGVVTFPMYAELKKNQKDCYGVDLRVKDKAALIALCEYVFPNIDKQNGYNKGSTSTIAPFLDALMKTVACLGSDYNHILSLFDNVIDSGESLIIDSSWVEAFDNLEDLQGLIRQIPIQGGNEGVVIEQQPAMSQSTNQPFNNQQVFNNGQFNQASQQKPELVKTANGVTFDSFLRTNPNVAAAVANMNNQQVRMPTNNPANRIPSWLKPEPGAVPNLMSNVINNRNSGGFNSNNF